jgi:stalled ribosome rescue protein Dom34
MLARVQAQGEQAMTLFHAVLWIDHHNARIQQFNATDVESRKVKDHSHYTRQHGSDVRAIHELFGEVCDALAGVSEILVTGSHQAQADFRHYVEKHRAALLGHVSGWETVDHLTDAQLVAVGRKFFDNVDRVPPPKAAATK